MPARWVPLLYFLFGYGALGRAFGELCFRPDTLMGFFYHPRMLAVVHLVTLGWISASILGALYLIGPLAFRMPLPARFWDYLAWACFAIGVSGMVSHFWMGSPAGMVWAAGLTALAMSGVAARALWNLAGAPVPFESRVPVGLALMNVIAASSLGVLVAANKVRPVLTLRHLDVVWAHAHFAMLGWGTMMVVGAGYRLLPMILPSAMPRGPFVLASAGLLEAGLASIVWGFLGGGPGLRVGAVLVLAGLGAFLSRVAWMLRNRRPAPTALVWPDWGVLHALQSLVYLVVSSLLGTYLAFAPSSETTLALGSAYGACGLVGFLSQIIVGVEGRLLPLYAWLWGFVDRGHGELPPSLHAANVRPLQALSFGLWTLGVPALAVGLASDARPGVQAGAGALLVAVVASLANAIVVLVRLWRWKAH
jgi:hypothetical protein